jgi:hypothetical protein
MLTKPSGQQFLGSTILADNHSDFRNLLNECHRHLKTLLKAGVCFTLQRKYYKYLDIPEK